MTWRLLFPPCPDSVRGFRCLTSCEFFEGAAHLTHPFFAPHSLRVFLPASFLPFPCLRVLCFHENKKTRNTEGAASPLGGPTASPRAVQLHGGGQHGAVAHGGRGQPQSFSWGVNVGVSVVHVGPRLAVAERDDVVSGLALVSARVGHPPLVGKRCLFT